MRFPCPKSPKESRDRPLSLERLRMRKRTTRIRSQNKQQKSGFSLVHQKRVMAGWVREPAILEGDQRLCPPYFGRYAKTKTIRIPEITRMGRTVTKTPAIAFPPVAFLNALACWVKLG